MSADSILASLGIEAGVGSHPTLSACPNGAPSDNVLTGTSLILTVVAFLPMLVLGYLTFRTRRIWLQFVRDRFEYILSTRTDLNFRLNYEFWVGGEKLSTVTLETNRLPEPLAHEMESVTTAELMAEDELSEVVVLE